MPTKYDLHLTVKDVRSLDSLIYELRLIADSFERCEVTDIRVLNDTKTVLGHPYILVRAGPDKER